MTKKAILGLTLAGCAVSALAQMPPSGGGGAMAARILARADADNDGIVTRAEAMSAAAARFDRMDANHDNVLTPDEMRPAGRGGGEGAAPPPPAGAPMTRDEWTKRVMDAFDRADANHDGKLDQAELGALGTPMRGDRGGAAPMPSPPSN